MSSDRDIKPPKFPRPTGDAVLDHLNREIWGEEYGVRLHARRLASAIKRRDNRKADREKYIATGVVPRRKTVQRAVTQGVVEKFNRDNRSDLAAARLVTVLPRGKA